MKVIDKSIVDVLEFDGYMTMEDLAKFIGENKLSPCCHSNGLPYVPLKLNGSSLSEKFYFGEYLVKMSSGYFVIWSTKDFQDKYEIQK